MHQESKQRVNFWLFGSVAQTHRNSRYGSEVLIAAQGVVAQKRLQSRESQTPWAVIRAMDGCCRITLSLEDSHRDSMRLDEAHAQAILCPLPHDELIRLHCGAEEARFAVDLVGQGPDLACAA